MANSNIRQACLVLSSVCDGAKAQDGEGFNKMDAIFARDLLKHETWTDAQAKALHKMLRKYKGQLSSLGVDYDTIPIPEDVPKAQPKVIKNTSYKNGRVYLSFRTTSKDDFFQIIDFIKALPGREYHADRKIWSIPDSKYNIDSIKENGFDLCPELKNKVAESECPLPEIKVPDNLSLYPFQVEGVQMLERLNGKALLADEMGLGKTVQAVTYLKLHPEDRPALIIVPASIKINWQREINKWLPGENTTVISGSKTAITGDENIIIINYDILKNYLELLSEMNIKIVIIDESSNIKNSKTLRAKAVKYISKGVEKVICISGTPIMNRPGELFTTLNLLDPQQFNNWYRYAKEFCSPTYNGFGWDFKGASNTEKLNNILVNSFMIRRLKKDVLKDLPPKVRSVIPIELKNRTEYDIAENDLIQWIFNTEGKESAHKASMAEALVRFEKLKQLSIKGKLDDCIEWIENIIESEKLVVFCVHHSVIDALKEKFGDIAVKLDGRDNINERQKSVDSFQNDPNVKLFIGNIKAAGMGITLTSATNVAFLECDWVPALHDQAESRCHRIGSTGECINIYYLVGLGTIEEELLQIIDHKRVIISQIMDGDMPEDNSLISELIEKYKERGI